MLLNSVRSQAGARVIAREQAYLGWRFGFEAESAPYEAATLRLIGHQGGVKLLLVRRGKRYRYSSYDERGHLIRVVVSDGATAAVSSDGKTFQQLESPAAELMDGEAAMFCNDFQGLSFQSPRALQFDGVEATKAMLRKGILEVAVHRDGALAGVAIATVGGVELLRPVAVTRISSKHRFYSVWRRNDESEIVWDRLEPHPKVYDSEVVLPA
jgi:hypothetical protein